MLISCLGVWVNFFGGEFFFLMGFFWIFYAFDTYIEKDIHCSLGGTFFLRMAQPYHGMGG